MSVWECSKCGEELIPGMLFKYDPKSRMCMIPPGIELDENRMYHFVLEWSTDLVPGGRMSGHYRRILCGPVRQQTNSEPPLAWGSGVD